MTADEIKAKLADRHAKDTWVPECKTGSSWGGASKLDGWALLSTWSPWTTIGYEIKVSRSDFIRDDKWPNYLPCCHLFYFVCPPKVIAKEEVPEGCGLIYAGARLLTKIKAPRREPDPEAMIGLMTYVLMSRVSIRENMYVRQEEDRADSWRRWLAGRQDDADLGQCVSDRLHEKVGASERRARAAEAESEKLGWFREALIARGLDPDDSYSKWQVAQQVDRAIGVMDESLAPNLERGLHKAKRDITAALDAVEAVRKAASK